MIQLGDWLPAGFVVITFQRDEHPDEGCPLGRCVLGVVRFDHQSEAHDYVRNLDPDSIDQHPHVIPLNRIAGPDDVDTEAGVTT